MTQLQITINPVNIYLLKVNHKNITMTTEITQNSQENTFTRVSFLIKLWAEVNLKANLNTLKYSQCSLPFVWCLKERHTIDSESAILLCKVWNLHCFGHSLVSVFVFPLQILVWKRGPHFSIFICSNSTIVKKCEKVWNMVKVNKKTHTLERQH